MLFRTRGKPIGVFNEKLQIPLSTLELSEEYGPLVSVLVPWRYGERWVANLTQTLLRQSWGKWEAIVVADGCAPPTFEDDRFKVFALPSNVGISEATNEAFRRSQGELVMFLDQDDSLDSECIKILISRLLENPQWAGVFAARNILRGAHSTEDKKRISRLDELYSHQVGHPLMFRRDKWVNHRKEFDTAQDADFAQRLMDRNEIGFTPEILYSWNLHGENPSLVSAKRQQSLFARAAKETKRRRSSSPSVSFILPSVRRAGGVKVALEMANLLQAKDWGVSVVDLSGGLEPFIPCQVPILRTLPTCVDLAIATSWDDTVKTALEHEKRRNGFAGWLIQDWEAGWYPWMLDRNPGVRNVVATAQWLKNRIQSDWNREADLLPYGLNTDDFPITRKAKPSAPSVLMCYRGERRKNPEGTLALAEFIAKRLKWKVTIIAATALPRVPIGCESIRAQDVQGMRRLYLEHAFFVSRSVTEGLFLMATEAMACSAIPVVQEGGTEHIEGLGFRLRTEATCEEYAAALEEGWGTWSSRSEAGCQAALDLGWERAIENYATLFKRWVRNDYNSVPCGFEE